MALLWRGLLPHGQARAAGLTLLGKIGFLLLALAAGLTFYPVLRAHQLGQVQVFINLALGLALMVLRRQPVASGVLVGLCCLFKPQYLLFALWALSRRQWGWLLGLAGTVGLGTLAALFVYGLEPHLQYVAFLQGVARTGEVFWLNQSLNGLLNRLLQTGNPVLWDSSAFPAYHAVVHRGTMLGSLLVLLLALLGRRAATDRELDFAAMLAALTLASPIAWEHHYGSFLPIFGLLLGRLVTANTPRPVGWQLGLLGLSYVLMANAVLRPEWLFSLPLGNGWSLHLWFGALVLFGLLLHGRRQGQAAGSMSAMSALRAGQNPKGAS